MNNKIDTPWKHTSRGNWREEQLKETEESFFVGLFGTVTLLTNALIWLILASVLATFDVMIASYVCVGIAALCITVWVIMHVIPRAWKWFINLSKV